MYFSVGCTSEAHWFCSLPLFLLGNILSLLFMLLLLSLCKLILLLAAVFVLLVTRFPCIYKSFQFPFPPMCYVLSSWQNLREYLGTYQKNKSNWHRHLQENLINLGNLILKVKIPLCTQGARAPHCLTCQFCRCLHVLFCACPETPGWMQVGAYTQESQKGGEVSCLHSLKPALIKQKPFFKR